MDNIVKELVKLDLHIHSALSKKKDKEKVANNTIENVDILIEKLQKNKVNMISITDHNAFDMELYNKVKSYEGKKIKKILPGIEFDVEIRKKRVHIITVFDDRHIEKINEIPDKINIPFDNTKKNAFTEKTFKDILKNIDLNVLLIVHQKSGIRANNQNENLAKVGEKEFDSIIGIDYFDAVEFRSGKVEGILNDYKYEKQLNNLRYITGTDCHVWNVYPQQDENDKTDIKYSYIKSLPTFKGLVMALTEPKRVTTSLFEVTKPFIPKINMKLNGKENDINLSSGLNVIIGDNSIGKSLILESLIDSSFKNIKPKSKQNGYKNYLKDKKIKLIPFSDDELKKIQYDCQGEIREKFQSGTKLLDLPLFKEKFKELDNSEDFKNIYSYVDKILARVDYNQELEDKENELDFEIEIPCEIENTTYLLRIVDNLTDDKKDYSKIIAKINEIIKNLNELCSYDMFGDTKIIETVIKKLSVLLQKYNNKLEIENDNESVKTVIKSICKIVEDKNQQVSEAQENKLTLFKQNIVSASKRITDYLKVSNENISNTLDSFKEINIKKEEREEGKYKFVTKTVESKIDLKEINKILTSPLSNVRNIESVEKLNLNNFKEKLKKSLSDDGKNSKEKYKKAITEYINSKVLKQELLIYKCDEKLEQGNSPGKNALIYLDVLADENSKKLYIVDQPGDDISHTRLTSDVIEILRRMSSNKQVLFITHKPELVVNLDVDNVIIIKEQDSKIEIINGALEYEDADKKINILKEVANILDGGEETIRKRWKRYDK